ncbi:MAG TPA: ZIP family metal transporter [Gemmataceae bacterium]|nr:ZIP family metal transporter [Gemmataceae bacterium]
MSEHAWLTVYCVAVLLFSMCGGYVPLVGRVSHTKLQFYLSASAGVMLGAAFFHVMPDARARLNPFWFGFWLSVGVVGMFFIERFIAPHTHEIDGAHHHAHHDHASDSEARPMPHDHNHAHQHESAHAHEEQKEYRAVAPAMAGWMAVLGLTIHTFMNGVGLAGAVQEAPDSAGWLPRITGLTWPGLAMFCAIFFHKPADALAISTVLSRKGVGKPWIMLVQFGFALMIPLGVLVFYWTKGNIEKDMQGQFTGAALAMSAGTFLFIALSDLLPEVQFHRHDRVPLFLMLILGVVLMAGIALLEGHEDGHSQGASGTKEEANHKEDKHDGHHHGHKDHHDHDHD